MKSLKGRAGSMLATLMLSALSPCVMAATLADADPFYAYDGSQGPLASVPLGAVIKQRVSTYYFSGSQTPYTLVQVLYRTHNALKQPVVNVTSIIRGSTSNGRAVMEGLPYDSTDPFDSPSYQFWKMQSPGTQGWLASLLGRQNPQSTKVLADQGYSVIVPDTEGETADFAVGEEEGMVALDAIRASLNAAGTGLDGNSRVAMMGYSGGAIAADWAAQLAPRYAPDINSKLVGAAFGGLLISPINNIAYIDGKDTSGVAPLALVGMFRGYGMDPNVFLNLRGEVVFASIKYASLAKSIPLYPFNPLQTNLKWKYRQDVDAYLLARLAGKENPSLPAELQTIVDLVNYTNVALLPAPTIPIYFTQGSNSVGLLNIPVTGKLGDGLMLADDARSLVQQFCKTNDLVEYHEPFKNHITAAKDWMQGAIPWIKDRFDGVPATGNCAWANTLRGAYIGPVKTY